MIYTPKIQKAVELAIKTHEIDQKQKRKGKDIAYITHPLTVGLILARANASENVIIAGLLHDAIEDSVEEDEISQQKIKDLFGEEVLNLVMSVSEKNKDLSWENRKENFLEELKGFSQESLILKSADIINNLNEIADDHAKEGERVFRKFNAPKERVLGHKLEAIEFILDQYPDNPLADDLKETAQRINNINI